MAPPSHKQEAVAVNDDSTPSNTPSRVSGIIGSGQSLSVGVQGPLHNETAPVRDTYKLHDRSGIYDIKKPESSSLELVPFTEPFIPDHTPGMGQYPNNVAGKTPHQSMAEQILWMSTENGASRSLSVHSTVGISGAGMEFIRKNGVLNAYEASLYEASALTRLCTEKHLSLEYDAIIFTHGERDAVLDNQNYCADLIQFQKDYAEDLKRITGQETSPVLILSQEQAVSRSMQHNGERSQVIQDQWQAQFKSNAIICAGPKYQYEYAPGNLHFSATGYNRLGEKYGQAFYQSVVEKKAFIPLCPKSVSLEKSGVILVRFNVPYPPLQWDSLLPWPHKSVNREWRNGRGFEVADTEGRHITIKGVDINGDGSSVSIHVDDSEHSTPSLVAYAMTADQAGFNGNLESGLMGHLCDSDPMMGAGAQSLKCTVTSGSSEIFSEAGFQYRAKYDIVGPDVGVIMEVDQNRPTRVKLDRPWQEPSGDVDLQFHHNHRNYLVSFWMEIRSAI